MTWKIFLSNDQVIEVDKKPRPYFRYDPTSLYDLEDVSGTSWLISPLHIVAIKEVRDE